MPSCLIDHLSQVPEQLAVHLLHDGDLLLLRHQFHESRRAAFCPMVRLILTRCFNVSDASNIKGITSESPQLSISARIHSALLGQLRIRRKLLAVFLEGHIR